VSLGPNFPGETIGTQVANRKFWTTTVGWFAGADLEFAFDRYTVTGSFDYTYARPESYGLLSVNTTFNPGGMSFGLTGGMRF
jgi:hypothetical protein